MDGITGKFFMINEATSVGTIGDAANDVWCVPLSKFRGFTNNNNTDTNFHMYFDNIMDPNDTDATNMVTVSLTITANKHREVTEDIIDLMWKSHNNLIVLGDKTTGKYASKWISDIAVSVPAAD